MKNWKLILAILTANVVLMAAGYTPERYTASQGVCVGRAGLVHLQRDSTGQVWTGGECVTCITGSVHL